MNQVRQPDLKGLIAAVDQFPRRPKKADITSLARKYGDSEFMVRHLFQYKAYRLTPNKGGGYRWPHDKVGGHG